MKAWKKVVLAVAGVFGATVAGVATTVALRWDRQFERPTPEVTRSTDPDVLARGEYLVWGPGHCAGCHGDVDRIEEYEATGERIPLTGGFSIDIAPGSIRPVNLTGCKTTGIGSMTDGEIARALRHSVGRDGRTLFPIMPFTDLAKSDMDAIISYLRALEPVTVERAPTKLSPLGKALMAFAIEPVGPSGPVPESVTPAASAEYGKYLVHSVANCYGCHTDRDLKTGAFIGEPMAGGLHLDHRGTTYVVPNITPGGEGSRIKDMTLESFKMRLRSGAPSAKGSPMPWAPFKSLSDQDLDAIWAYLQSVPKVDKDVGPPIAAG